MSKQYPTRIEARVTTETGDRVNEVWRRLQAEALPGVNVARGSAIRLILLTGLQQVEGGVSGDGSQS
mgnify:CR=1 FL=1